MQVSVLEDLKVSKEDNWICWILFLGNVFQQGLF